MFENHIGSVIIRFISGDDVFLFLLLLLIFICVYYNYIFLSLRANSVLYTVESQVIRVLLRATKHVCCRKLYFYYIIITYSFNVL